MFCAACSRLRDSRVRWIEKARKGIFPNIREPGPGYVWSRTCQRFLCNACCDENMVHHVKDYRQLLLRCNKIATQVARKTFQSWWQKLRKASIELQSYLPQRFVLEVEVIHVATIFRFVFIKQFSSFSSFIVNKFSSIFTNKLPPWKVLRRKYTSPFPFYFSYLKDEKPRKIKKLKQKRKAVFRSVFAPVVERLLDGFPLPLCLYVVRAHVNNIIIAIYGKFPVNIKVERGSTLT